MYNYLAAINLYVYKLEHRDIRPYNNKVISKVINIRKARIKIRDTRQYLTTNNLTIVIKRKY